MLWEWSGKDKFGKVRAYQTSGPDCAPASMLTHLRQSFHNLEISEPPTRGAAFKPSIGIVERHTFDYGIAEEVERMLGMNATNRARIISDRIRRNPKPFVSLLDSAHSLLRRK